MDIRRSCKIVGVKTTVRTWHINRSGYVVEQVDPFEKGSPTANKVRILNKVPGSDFPCITVYAVSQSISWLAKERRDVQEQLEWKQQIPELIGQLMGKKVAA